MPPPSPVLLMVRALGLGGSERQLAEMARRLDRERFSVQVGCFQDEGFRAVELRAAGIPVVRFPVRSFHGPGLLKGAWQLAGYIQRRQIRLVHTFDVPMNLFGVPAARALAPRVISSQRASRELTPGLTRHLLRLTDRMADAVVVNCLAVRRHLIEDERVPASRIYVCLNGIDTELFRPLAAARPEELRGASLVIGCVCALRPEKGLSTLLEAFARVRHLQPGLKLAIVGDGPERAALEDLARRLELGEDCLLIPATEQVARWLRGMDIFVLPSLSEALSNALMEAMACGCAVVASRTGGNPELVSAGDTGLLFRPGDAAELAQKLGLLITGEPLRRRVAASAAALIPRRFSQAAAASRMAEIYGELLAPETRKMRYPGPW